MAALLALCALRSSVTNLVLSMRTCMWLFLSDRLVGSEAKNFAVVQRRLVSPQLLLHTMLGFLDDRQRSTAKVHWQVDWEDEFLTPKARTS